MDFSMSAAPELGLSAPTIGEELSPTDGPTDRPAQGPAQGDGSEDAEPPSPVDEVVRQKPSLVLLTVVSVVSAVLDLASKWWAETNLTGFDASLGGPKRFVVVEGLMDFVYAQNPGGAWSMLRGLPEIIRRPFFLFVSSVAVVFIIAIYVRIDARQSALKWGLPLALGGAVGNLVDRMRYGYVVDFIHVFYEKGTIDFHWPTFNVADIAIVAGVALMAIDLLFGKDPTAKQGDGDDGDGGPPLPLNVTMVEESTPTEGDENVPARNPSEGFAGSSGLS